MRPNEYPVLAKISNDTDREITVYLEMLGEEVVMSPGHSFELLAAPSQDLLPLSFSYSRDGIQIHPHKEFDPDWHIRFNDKLLRPGHPTLLAHHES